MIKAIKKDNGRHIVKEEVDLDDVALIYTLEGTDEIIIRKWGRNTPSIGCDLIKFSNHF